MATTGAPRVSTASSRREAARGGSSRFSWRGAMPVLFLAPALLLYGLFVLWPIIDVFRLSLTNWNGYGPERFVGFANLPSLWSDSTFRTALHNSVLWEGGATVLTTALGLLLALLLSRAHGAGIARAALFFPVLLPPTVVAVIWSLVYSPIVGPLNSVLNAVGLRNLTADWLGDPHLALPALFVAWLWSTVSVGALVLSMALNSIGDEYREIAALEGAGPLWRFRHVTLPGIRRPLAAVLLLNAALGSQVFDLVYVTTGGGPGYATMLLPIDMYGRAFGGHAGQGAMVAAIQLVLGLVLAAAALVLFSRRSESMDTGVVRDVERRRVPATICLYLVVLLLALPLLWLLPAALQPGRSFALGGTSYSPANWTGANVSTVLASGMAGAIGTSTAIAGIVVAGALLLGGPAAFAVALVLPGAGSRAVVLGVLLIGLLQPTQVLTIPLFALLHDLNLLDSPLGIVLPEIARLMPFTVLLLWAFLAQLPREVFEAARIDGASVFEEMRSIALPLIRPALAAAGIWAFVSSWNEYLLPTIVSQDAGISTVPTLLGSFIGKFDTQFGALAAGAVFALLPSLCIYLALGRAAASGVARAEGGVR